MELHFPDREIALQVAVAWHPRWWTILPRLKRKPPEGWRGGFEVTWLFIHLERWWRFV